MGGEAGDESTGGKGGSGGTSGSGGKGGSGGTSGSGGKGACSGATACLVHRYSFGGTGTTATDSIGTANGTVVNTTVQSGGVTLSGGTSDQHVNLPITLFSGLTSATFEVWVTWNGGAAWQRIFDFGANDGAGPGSQGPNGTRYLFLTPRATNSSGLLRVAYSLDGPGEEVGVSAQAALTASTMNHLAVVVDDAADTLALYVNGASAGQATLTGTLADLDIENSWLGRSQFSADPEFGGIIHEFRIYAAARTAAQIQASHTAGPDTPPAN
jgi:hypothetical protein